MYAMNKISSIDCLLKTFCGYPHGVSNNFLHHVDNLKTLYTRSFYVLNLLIRDVMWIKLYGFRTASARLA